MFEAAHAQRLGASPAAVWRLWSAPARWGDWDPRVERAQAEGELGEGVEVRVKLRKGGTTRQRVVAFEPERRLALEYSLPGARVGQDHLLEPAGSGSEVTHRLYVDGPLSGFWALMLGRRRLREAVAEFAVHEESLAG